MKEKIKDILIVIKDKLRSKMAVVIYIFTVIFVLCVIFIKVFSIKVLSCDEIKDTLINKVVIIDGSDVQITDENLVDLTVISRKTKKDNSDKVDVKIKYYDGESEKNLKGIIIFNYDDGWQYKSCDFKNTLDLDDKENIEGFIKNSLMENGFSTTDNRVIYPSVISKINNINIDGDSIYEGKVFSLHMTLYNGVFFQNCKLKGGVYYNNSALSLKDMELVSEEKVYRENNVDEEIIKDTALSELLNGGVVCLEYDDKYREEYIKPDKNSIKDFVLKSYIVRNDYTIRAEVEGSIEMAKYAGEYKFNGTICITNKLSIGNVKNSNKINIYDVPFEIDDDSDKIE